MTASCNQIYFFFIVNIAKNKIRITKQTSTKLQRRNHYSEYAFSWASLNSQTTNPPTNRPLTTYPPTSRLPTQRPTESIIIFGRLVNRKTLILQNTSTTGKTYSYTPAYYSKHLLVSINYIRRSQLYLVFYLLNFFFFLPRYFKITFYAWIFFSVYSVSII